jgi:hypothetical protein
MYIVAGAVDRLSVEAAEAMLAREDILRLDVGTAVPGRGPASSQLTASLAVVAQGRPTFVGQLYVNAIASRPSECLRMDACRMCRG